MTTADQNTCVADAAALYEHGVGLYDSGDRCAGEEFWSKADAGHSDAQYNLGVLLYERAGDEPAQEALNWCGSPPRPATPTSNTT